MRRKATGSASTTWKDTICPPGVPGRAEEVARVCCFLAGEGADYMTGETVHVDGGLTITF